MSAIIREYRTDDLSAMCAVWNEVVKTGVAFPQEHELTANGAAAFFAEQSFTGVAVYAGTGKILGLYILHPNNVGRCGHIANASYAVSTSARGMGTGKQLVLHSMEQAKALHFTILQFNAVVKTNVGAIKLYKQLGFVPLGAIPGGFRTDSGYEDIIPFYKTL